MASAIVTTRARLDDDSEMAQFLSPIPNGQELAKVLKGGNPVSTRAYEDETRTARFVESDGNAVFCFTVSDITIDQAEMIEAAWAAIGAFDESAFRRTVERVLDRYNLGRFLDAQRGVHEQAERELRAGRKQSHWMWFIFPQIQGLGHSAMAQRYAISCAAEAEAYLDHPLLGARLRSITRTVININGRSIEEIFGYPDYRKFQSSMTLFAIVGEDNQVFEDALQKYFGAQHDGQTIKRL